MCLVDLCVVEFGCFGVDEVFGVEVEVEYFDCLVGVVDVLLVWVVERVFVEEGYFESYLIFVVLDCGVEFVWVVWIVWKGWIV